MRLFLLSPQIIFQAQVNGSVSSYPVDTITYDTVVTGTYTNIAPGMTVLFGSTAGASDRGMQRIRKPATSSQIYIGRASNGSSIGQVTADDNTWITVLDDYRVWGKTPFFDEDGTVYMDSDIAYTDENEQPPPVANCGPGYAGTISSGYITVQLDGSSSFATAPGASISSYSWNVADGTIISGTSTDPTITVQFPGGFRWVSLTVTDSNGKTHTARCPIYARDPNNDTSIEEFQIERHTITQQGQIITLHIYKNLDPDLYPDGTLAIIFDGEPASASDRSNILFIGWHDGESENINSLREGFQNNSLLTFTDVAGQLNRLPGFTKALEYSTTDTGWLYTQNANINHFLHYILHWHSTALELADWEWVNGGDSYTFTILATGSGSLLRQVSDLCGALVPDHIFTYNRLGKLRVLPDPLIQDTADRTATVQRHIVEDEWTDLDYEVRPHPQYYWLRENAVKVGSFTDPNQITPLFSIAPGTSPGMGSMEQTKGEQLALNQADLNISCGNRYARLNAKYSEFKIRLANGDVSGLDPADMTWVELTLSSTSAAYRELSFTQARGLLKQIDITYVYNKSGMYKEATLVWEKETSGLPGVTEIPEVGAEVPQVDNWWPGYYDDNFDEPAPSSPFAGNPAMYVMWSRTKIVRTANIMDTYPNWEDITGTITGDIKDAFYVMPTQSSVGMWVMTTDGIWWTEDITAPTVTWQHKLDYATATDSLVFPSDGDPFEFVAMAHAPGTPGYLIVLISFFWDSTSDFSYNHCYFRYTTDYGDTWSLHDMDYYTYSSLGYTRTYYGSGTHGLSIMDGTTRVAYFGAAPRVGASGRGTVFVSETLSPLNFVALHDPPSDSPAINDGGRVSVKWQFPNGSPIYSIRGTGTTSQNPKLYLNDSLTAQPLPSGYDAIQYTRPNQDPNNPDHLIAWFRVTGSYTDWSLFETFDQGSTWSGPLYSISMSTGISYASVYQTPNGWPGNSDMWWIVRMGRDTSTDPVLLYTDDRFGTITDRTGNLFSVIGTWYAFEDGINGVALPRVGYNT